MRVKFIILFSVITLGLIGCAPNSMYQWGNYEHKLYSYYKNPAEVEKLAESLAKIIEKGEMDGRVPPGIYAEYGYTLLITGNIEEAVTYFEKEKIRWPESTILMDKMIVSAKDGDKKRAAEDTKQTAEAGGGAIQ